MQVREEQGGCHGCNGRRAASITCHTEVIVVLVAKGNQIPAQLFAAMCLVPARCLPGAGSGSVGLLETDDILGKPKLCVCVPLLLCH